MHNLLDIPHELICDLSLVVPAYNEEENVRAFFEEALRVLSELNGIFEIIFVDDGSKDSTYAEIQRVVEDVNRLPENLRTKFLVQGISFSRNFGKDAAFYAGLEVARGRNIASIDVDLEQPLPVLVAMYKELLSDEEIDCVAAYQERRRSSALRNFLSSKFYNVFSSASNMDVVLNASEFRVFRRNVATALLNLKERDRFTKGLFAWIGFNVKPYAFVPDKRHAGTTSYSMTDLFKYAILGLMSFSTAPLRIVSHLGLGISGLAILYFIFIIAKRLMFGVEIAGYATIVGLILLLGGIQLLVLGLIGEYLAQTFIQGKDRPIYISRKHITSDGNLQEDTL
ncbi:MAG: glycosyltransferase family 2 protein [Eggerthellaceae bacterium]|nr:glycosyltransferase family 2 protein [Eggerthellaceae bacterium]